MCDNTTNVIIPNNSPCKENIVISQEETDDIDFNEYTAISLKTLCKLKKIGGASNAKKETLIECLNKDTTITKTELSSLIKSSRTVKPATAKSVPVISNTRLKPLVKWSGGKSDEIDNIIPHLPDKYSCYIEPFIGGGALYFDQAPDKAVISDVHMELVDLYRSIKSGHINDIYEYMDNHPNNEETYYKVRGYDTSGNTLENAKRFYYLRKTCFRGMLRYNKKGQFNIPFGRYKTCNYDVLKNDAYEKLLQRTEVLNESFEYVFENYNSSDNFMFLDPPYDSEFTDYGYCSFGKEEQKLLADCFKKTDIMCLMIIGKTPFISELYKDYIVGEYDKKYRFKLHSGRIGDEINTKHLIIKNY